MSIRTVTHLNFQGNARAALAFYSDVFKGQQTLVTYAQAGRAQDAVDPDHVLWGQITGEDGIALMAYVVQAGMLWHPGDKAFFVSLRGDHADTVRTLWNGLADGANILHALTPSQWSPLYGMLRDRFGITWVVDLSVPYSPA
jgi:PhnB protein